MIPVSALTEKSGIKVNSFDDDYPLKDHETARYVEENNWQVVEKADAVNSEIAFEKRSLVVQNVYQSV